MAAQQACGWGGGRNDVRKGLDQLREMIGKVQQMQAGLMGESPLHALCLNPMIDAAREIGQARKALKQLIRQNQENALNRARADQQRGRSGLESRLMKDPAAALAEAESTRQGLQHMIEMWRSLGAALLEKDGLNDEEYQMACKMLGAPHVKLRTSKARLAFDRALKADKDRKFVVIEDRSQTYMDIYIKRLADETWRAYIRENNMEAAIFDAFMKRYKDWVQYLLAQLDEEEEFYRQWCERPPIHRNYWKCTRKIVAEVILKYRALLKSAKAPADKPVAGEWTAHETRKVENARKVLNTALSNFQKGVNIAKNAGFFNPVKLSKKTVEPKDECVADMHEEATAEPASSKTKRGKIAGQTETTKHPLKCNPGSEDLFAERALVNVADRAAALTEQPSQKPKQVSQPKPESKCNPPRKRKKNGSDESS